MKLFLFLWDNSNLFNNTFKKKNSHTFIKQHIQEQFWFLNGQISQVKLEDLNDGVIQNQLCPRIAFLW